MDFEAFKYIVCLSRNRLVERFSLQPQETRFETQQERGVQIYSIYYLFMR
jgi:hypothetical protein